MLTSLYLRLITMTIIVLLPYTASAAETVIGEEFDCIVNPSRVADLGSNATGVISRVVVDRNDFVKRGDIVAVLDVKVEQTRVELAKKRASITSEIELSNINFTHAERELKRVSKAYKRGSISAHDLDKANTELQLAKIKKVQADENQYLALKELKQVEATLGRRTILAPFPGVVMERLKVIGEHISDEAVVRLAQIDPLYVEVIVPVSKFGKIQKGMQAKVWSDIIEGNAWNATVTQVDKVMDAASGTFGVRLTLPNPDHKIPAGLRGHLKFFDIPLQQLSKQADTTRQADINKPEQHIDPISTALASLSVKEDTAVLEQTIQDQLDGYLLLSGILHTQDEQRDFLASLEAAGVKDHMSIRQGDGSVRISFGAYNQKEFALGDQAMLADKGITAYLEPWRKKSRYTADSVAALDDKYETDSIPSSGM